MIGIDDPWVGLAYVLCLGSAGLCLVYGWRHWNRGEEILKDEDVHWAAEEDKAEEKL
jgi:hypothetical protein